ncbi:DUF6597 domain-containing transcriptional factor [Dysgonomonas sp. ZJ279]|uniref:DUF6597 domain-containing transcriptional factor n=1 Tax=Dysgonomonas sp. ZJ279 TaxID=2709796 RepID=UPI0013EDEF98|nr:DUF6597 domain-containing transcriptional factor [Dysgonomonas sp. ZJ279]
MTEDCITYREFTPHPLLADYVKSYWYFSNESDTVHSFDIMPDGYFDLLISFKSGNIVDTQLTGIWSKMVSLDYLQGQIIGIRFKPLALYSLLDIRIKDILNNYCSLPLKAWGLNDEIIETKSDKSVLEVIKYIDESLLLLIKNEKEDIKLKYLFEQIGESSGITSIQSISDSVGLSARHINRKMNELIGISTKDYAKIVRFKDSLARIKKDKSDFIGYFDQSHFIKDFKKYTGFTPKEIDLGADVRFLQYYDFDNI